MIGTNNSCLFGNCHFNLLVAIRISLVIVIYDNFPFATEYICKMIPWQMKCNAYFFTVSLLEYWTIRPSKKHPKYRAVKPHIRGKEQNT